MGKTTHCDVIVMRNTLVLKEPLFAAWFIPHCSSLIQMYSKCIFNSRIQTKNSGPLWCSLAEITPTVTFILGRRSESVHMLLWELCAFSDEKPLKPLIKNGPCIMYSFYHTTLQHLALSYSVSFS